jgi:hypothetical protein
MDNCFFAYTVLYGNIFLGVSETNVIIKNNETGAKVITLTTFIQAKTVTISKIGTGRTIYGSTTLVYKKPTVETGTATVIISIGAGYKETSKPVLRSRNYLFRLQLRVSKSFRSGFSFVGTCSNSF